MRGPLAPTPEQREKFPPLCPDFVIELMSPSDTLKKTQEKMKEYLENGCSLGWLINRRKQEVEIYRQEQEVEVLKSPQFLSGENILPGFVLNLKRVWKDSAAGREQRTEGKRYGVFKVSEEKTF